MTKRLANIRRTKSDFQDQNFRAGEIGLESMANCFAEKRAKDTKATLPTSQSVPRRVIYHGFSRPL